MYIIFIKNKNNKKKILCTMSSVQGKRASSFRVDMVRFSTHTTHTLNDDEKRSNALILYMYRDRLGSGSYYMVVYRYL